ncbi:MAG: amino acid ABC transporter permease [Vagococcus sp.]
MEMVLKVLPALIEGTKMTLEVFALTLLISLPIGWLLGFLVTSRFKWLKICISLYIWVIRGTPLLLQLIIVFFGFPFIGIVISSRLLAVLIAFVINYSAYFAEIFRGGIQSVPVGQYEAAKVLGLSTYQTNRKIIMPQVLNIVFPSIGNEIITLVKDTSLIYALGLGEVMKAGRIAMQREASIIPLIVVACIYLMLTGIVTILLKWIERKRRV